MVRRGILSKHRLATLDESLIIQGMNTYIHMDLWNACGMRTTP